MQAEPKFGIKTGNNIEKAVRLRFSEMDLYIGTKMMNFPSIKLMLQLIQLDGKSNLKNLDLFLTQRKRYEWEGSPRLDFCPLFHLFVVCSY